MPLYLFQYLFCHIQCRKLGLTREEAVYFVLGQPFNKIICSALEVRNYCSQQ
jgi:hypothetical protein